MQDGLKHVSKAIETTEADPLISATTWAHLNLDTI